MGEEIEASFAGFATGSLAVFSSAAAAFAATRVWLDSSSHEMSSFIEYVGP